jgi:hypothetical protein
MTNLILGKALVIGVMIGRLDGGLYTIVPAIVGGTAIMVILAIGVAIFGMTISAVIEFIVRDSSRIPLLY